MPWLEQFKRLRAIAQTGLAYSRDDYDLERFEEVHTLSVRMLEQLLDVPPGRLEEVYLPERGYPTPKIDVRGGVFRDGRVLLVQEAADGLWTLPGGWGDEHDSPSAGIEREVREESGFDVKAAKLVAVKDRHLHPFRPVRLERVYKMYFLCDLLGGRASPSLETTAVDWFEPDRLPPLSMGRTLPADIEMLARHLADPALPCYFD